MTKKRNAAVILSAISAIALGACSSVSKKDEIMRKQEREQLQQEVLADLKLAKEKIDKRFEILAEAQGINAAVYARNGDINFYEGVGAEKEIANIVAVQNLDGQDAIAMARNGQVAQSKIQAAVKATQTKDDDVLLTEIVKEFDLKPVGAEGMAVGKFNKQQGKYPEQFVAHHNGKLSSNYYETARPIDLSELQRIAKDKDAGKAIVAQRMLKMIETGQVRVKTINGNNGKQSVQTAHKTGLERSVTLNGEYNVTELVSKLAAGAGYQFEVKNLRSLRMNTQGEFKGTIFEAMKQVGEMLGDKAEIVINQKTKVVELRFAGQEAPKQAKAKSAIKKVAKGAKK